MNSFDVQYAAASFSTFSKSSFDVQPDVDVVAAFALLTGGGVQLQGGGIDLEVAV